MLDTKSFKRFIELHAEKKKLTSDLKDIQYEIKQKEQTLIENLQDNGMNKISMDGKTCYTRVVTFAKISNKKEAITILKDNGYEYIVKENYNTNSVSKLVRDLLEENDGELPPEFEEVITSGSVAQLNVINA